MVQGRKARARGQIRRGGRGVREGPQKESRQHSDILKARQGVQKGRRLPQQRKDVPEGARQISRQLLHTQQPRIPLLQSGRHKRQRREVQQRREVLAGRDQKGARQAKRILQPRIPLRKKGALRRGREKLPEGGGAWLRQKRGRHADVLDKLKLHQGPGKDGQIRQEASRDPGVQGSVEEGRHKGGGQGKG